jgi:peptidoglycan biosynthesis protein MviN/MurJ (putative lipid II flippase)
MRRRGAVRRTFFRLLLGGIAGKVLGVVREVLLAALFGAGRVVGANRVALTATMVPINFFTADALTAGFLPLYVRYRQDDPPMALALYRAMRTSLAVLSLALVAALLPARNRWIDLLAPGLDGSTAALAASMLGIAALGVPFYILYNLYTLVALARDDVRPINLRASFQSIGLIAATLAAWHTGHVTLLAWGFTVPYVVLWCWGAWWVRHKGYLHHEPASAPSRVRYRVALSTVWRRLRPLLLIPVLLQGSIAVERAVGSLLGVEVVAATEYSRFVVDSLMALIAAPLGLAGLAAFARMPGTEVGAGLRRLIAPVLLLTVPLTVVLAVNSRGIIDLLYGRGRFDDRAVEVTSVLLLGFALGIWAQVLGYTLVKVLNAQGENARVAVVNGLAFGAAAATNVVMWRYWGPFTLGFAATVGGLVMFVGSALSLRIMRHCLGLLAMLAPGATVAAVAGFGLAGDGVVRLVASGTAVGLVWLGYVLAVPELRHTFVHHVWSRTAARRPRADAAAPTATDRSDAAPAEIVEGDGPRTAG